MTRTPMRPTPIALALLLALASHAPAAFVVDDTGEAGDANPGDGVCDTGAG